MSGVKLYTRRDLARLATVGIIVGTAGGAGGVMRSMLGLRGGMMSNYGGAMDYRFVECKDGANMSQNCAAWCNSLGINNGVFVLMRDYSVTFDSDPYQLVTFWLRNGSIEGSFFYRLQSGGVLGSVSGTATGWNMVIKPGDKYMYLEY